MHPHSSRKTNHLAIAGFLLPFVAAAVVGFLFLVLKEEVKTFKFFIPYLTLIPLLLLAGILASLKSIPLIEQRNDKDYAYSGLILNILFISLYVISLIYFFFSPPR